MIQLRGPYGQRSHTVGTININKSFAQSILARQGGGSRGATTFHRFSKKKLVTWWGEKRQLVYKMCAARAPHLKHQMRKKSESGWYSKTCWWSLRSWGWSSRQWPCQSSSSSHPSGVACFSSLCLSSAPILCFLICHWCSCPNLS